jgi:hypothetical protein
MKYLLLKLPTSQLFVSAYYGWHEMYTHSAASAASCSRLLDCYISNQHQTQYATK